MTETDSLATGEPDAEAVAAFLRRYPEFLARHPDVLATVRVPHQPGGGAVSLLERQLRLLRERNQQLEQRLAGLLETARENERLGIRLLGLARGLLEADSLDAALALVRDVLLNEFRADAVRIRLIDGGAAGARSAFDRARFLAPGAAELTHFADCLETGEPVCGGIELERMAALFGEDAASLASAAVVPLVAGRPLGLVGLASRDGAHFHPDMGTLFLTQLGEIVTAGVQRHLEAG